MKIQVQIIEENFEYVDGTKRWLLNEKLHRTDGPAVEYSNGTKRWYLNGKRHRTDGPAVERADGSKFWYVNDKPHRIDGPAIEWADGTKAWWVNGIEIDIDQIILTHELNPDWTQWSDEDKVLFRLAV